MYGIIDVNINVPALLVTAGDVSHGSIIPMTVLNPIPDSVTIQLPSGHTVYIDNVDADLAAMKWHKFKPRGIVYARQRPYVNGKRINLYMHRIILERMLGRPLMPLEQVDHKDGDGLNNRRDNLRLATIAQNKRNRGMQANNTSGYLGVHQTSTGRWEVTICHRYIGTFDTAEEGSQAYLQAAREIYGEFAPDEKKIRSS